jgi:hypothetical protein
MKRAFNKLPLSLIYQHYYRSIYSDTNYGVNFSSDNTKRNSTVNAAGKSGNYGYAASKGNLSTTAIRLPFIEVLLLKRLPLIFCGTCFGYVSVLTSSLQRRVKNCESCQSKTVRK